MARYWSLSAPRDRATIRLFPLSPAKVPDITQKYGISAAAPFLLLPQGLHIALRERASMSLKLERSEDQCLFVYLWMRPGQGPILVPAYPITTAVIIECGVSPDLEAHKNGLYFDPSSSELGQEPGSDLLSCVAPATPVCLSEVVIGLDAQAYTKLHSNPQAIVDQISAQLPMLSQGRTYTIAIPSAAAEVALHCLSTKPTSHGTFSTSTTRFVIARWNAVAKDSCSTYTSLGGKANSGHPEFEPYQTWNVESFIINSDHDIDSQLVPSYSLLAAGDLASGLATGRDGSQDGTTWIAFKPILLDRPIPASEISPVPDPIEDEDCRAFVSLSGMLRLGLTSGVWVRLSCNHRQDSASTAHHAAQLYVREGVWANLESDHLIYLPPSLAANLGISGCYNADACTVQISPLRNQHIPPEFLSAPEEAIHQCLPVPVARKVVFSRISSPLSERRDLDASIICALQTWLMGATGNPCDPVVAGGCVGPTECRNKYRIVKEGDIVALPIIPWKVETEASALDAMSKILLDRTTSSELVDSKLLVTLGRDIERADCVPTAIVEEGDVVFFKVESVTPYRQPLYDESDCEVGDCGSDGGDSNSSSESSLGPTTPTLSKRMDKEEAPELGEDGQLGCIINLSVTQVVQAGSVHSAVPYFHSRAYLGLRFGGTPTQELSHTPYERQYKRCRQLLGIPFHSQAKVQGLSCSILVKGPSGVGKRHLVHTVASELGFHVYELNCHDIVEDSEDQTAKVLRLYISNCRRYTPAIILLRCIEGLLPQNNQDPGASHAATPVTRELRRCLTELPGIHGTTGFPLIVVATSSDPERVLPPVAACFRHEISLEVPDKDTRHLLFKSILAETRFVVSPDINIDYLAQQTASFVARDIRSTVARASRLAWARTNGGADTNDSCSYEYTPPLDACLSGLVLSSSDMMAALASMRSAMSDTLGVPKIPNVKWEDVGGLATAKKDILDTIQLPLESPHLFASGMHTRSGLLFYGPPGTGKTLLAKAVATECGLNFFSVKGPELLNMYIGESEANVRRVFQKAREASPCVVFFDELDSLAPKRGQQGDSGGVMDRVVSQLLAELDGMSKGQGEANNGEDEAESVSPGKQQAHVFVIGATNRPDLLDPALLRPGRFDKLVYLGVSETHDAQLHILKALTRKFTLHPDLKLGEIAEKCPFNYTGADFYALCSDALLKAMLDKVESVDRLVEEWNASRRPAATGTKGDEPNSGKHPYPMTPQYYLDHLATPEQRDVVVERHHFLKALDELVPSVPTEELKRYQALRKQFDAGSKPTTSGVPTRANNLPPVKKGKGKRRAT